MTESNSTQMPKAPAPAPSAISKATDVASSFMEKMSGGRKRRHTKSKRSKSKRSMKGCSSKRRKRHSSHHKKRR